MQYKPKYYGDVFSGFKLMYHDCWYFTSYHIFMSLDDWWMVVLLHYMQVALFHIQQFVKAEDAPEGLYPTAEPDLRKRQWCGLENTSLNMCVT